MNLLVTGGAGFIGSNLVRFLLNERKDIRLVNLDLLTYAGNRDNQIDLEEDPRYRFVHGDICDGDRVRSLMEDVDAVLHLAAESHVDRSISNDAPFIRTNIVGTHVLLAAALDASIERFVQISTDEVYGELPWRDPMESSHQAVDAPRFTEESPVDPHSVYSASKVAGDHLAMAYHVTHGLNVIVTRCSNNYGPYQHPEKLIPLMITRALEGRDLPIYGDGLHVRDWLHVRDHCRGLLAVLEHGKAGEIYNFGGRSELKNVDVVRKIVEATGTDPNLVVHVSDRLGHDRRYAVDCSKAERQLDWTPKIKFDEGLRRTVRWYREHAEWWHRVETGTSSERIET